MVKGTSLLPSLCRNPLPRLPNYAYLQKTGKVFYRLFFTVYEREKIARLFEKTRHDWREHKFWSGRFENRPVNQ
jgi:hypothetical protein